MGANLREIKAGQDGQSSQSGRNPAFCVFCGQERAFLDQNTTIRLYTGYAEDAGFRRYGGRSRNEQISEKIGISQKADEEPSGSAGGAAQRVSIFICEKIRCLTIRISSDQKIKRDSYSFHERSGRRIGALLKLVSASVMSRINRMTAM